MSKRALVTGAAGFIGSYMCSRLIHDGWEVIPIDNKPGCSLATGQHDIRDLWRQSLTARWDLVVHCAAHVGGRADIEGRPTYLAAYNLQLDGLLFEWALKAKPAHIIYWSSSAAYPVAYQTKDDIGIRLKESDINVSRQFRPDATYGWVKLTGERLAAEARAEGLKVHVFRPFTGYGPGQSLDYPYPSFIDRARRRADPFEVWGSGEQVRDFIHIDDLVAGALTAVEQDYPGPLNLCTGVGTSFNQLADLVCRAAGYNPRIEHHLNAPVGVWYRVGDPAEMLKVYTPRITIEEAVTRALSRD